MHAPLSWSDPSEISSSTYEQLRRPPHPEHAELQPYTFKWIAKFPGTVRPLTLGQRFPRIANRLALIWSDAQIADAYLKELITPRREGRKGFPSEVAAEINRLYLHLRERLDWVEKDKPWMEPGHGGRQLDWDMY